MQSISRLLLLGVVLLMAQKLEANVQFINVEIGGKTLPIKPSEVERADLTQRNGWGGALVVLKDGRQGYSSEKNIRSLGGDVPIFVRGSKPKGNDEAPRAVEVSDVPADSTSKGHQGRQLPTELRERLMGTRTSNMGRSGGNGYGHIDRAATDRLFQNGQWNLTPACKMYNSEICEALAIDGESKNSDRLLMLKAIAIHESHMDPLSFRLEEAHARSNDGWMGRGWRRVKEHNPKWREGLDSLHYRQFYSSYGLMHVFVPALTDSSWYPKDLKHKGTPSDMSAKEVIENPARLLDPATNFLWGHRLVKSNFSQVSRMAEGNKSLSLIERMAAAYNGGATALRESPPRVSSVGCKKGIDPGCAREGSKEVPYHKSIRNIVDKLKNTCRAEDNRCGGR